MWYFNYEPFNFFPVDYYPGPDLGDGQLMSLNRSPQSPTANANQFTELTNAKELSHLPVFNGQGCHELRLHVTLFDLLFLLLHLVQPLRTAVGATLGYSGARHEFLFTELTYPGYPDV
jgi:hypothetical protein